MSRRQRALLVRTLLFLFSLNVLSISLYLLLNPNPDPTSPPSRIQIHTRPETHPLKPWPSLPSFHPWNTTRPSPRTCEAYFGNGFSTRIDLIPESNNNRSWIRCFYSETLESSVCEMGRVRMDPGRIRMSRGGEEIEAVIGRKEEEEMPRFEEGAFVVEREGNDGRRVVDEEVVEKYVSRKQVDEHPLRGMMESVRGVPPGELRCDEWIEEPTVLVTRFEYANLFHTVTDWYSAYVSSRVTSLPGRPHLIFVDGHCKASLEETWEALFSSVRYAKHFSGTVCFRHAILAPLGYETTLFKGLSETISCEGTAASILRENLDDRRTARLSEFGEMLQAAFNILTDDGMQTKPPIAHNVLFVRREDYLAHPRHSGKVESRLSNEQEVFDAIKNWAASQRKCKINVVNGLFAHMSMKEQLRAIKEASVVIGAHGAGLTHLVSATPDTVVLEIISSFYQRPHFQLISRWKGLEYHAINLAGSYARPAMVIDELSSIMSSLRC